MKYRLYLVPMFLMGFALLAARGQEQPTPKDDPRAKVGAKAGAKIDVDDKKAEANADANIRVEGRGPVHEAFAQPWEKNPGPNAAVPKRPPEPIAEEPPDQRPAGDRVQWLPGYWAWNAEDKNFLWVTGTWRVAPDGRHWAPGYWAETADGSIWVNGHWAGEGEQDIQLVPTPPENTDTGPSTQPPDDHSFYIPGSWFYTDAGWQWRDGYWTDIRAGSVWVPASYYWTPQGYIFTNGYWDYDPMNRGLLFAPVSFLDMAMLRSGFTYRPLYALATAGLLDSLFVNAGLGQYFFGDFFGPRYAGLGFTPWLTFGARSYDPLFNYVRFGSRTDAALAGLTLAALRANLDARLAGRLAAPPRTLSEQLKLAASAGTTIKVTTTTTAIVAPMADLSKAANLKLEPVAAQQQATIKTNVQKMVNRSVELGKQASQPRVEVKSMPRIGVQGSGSAAGRVTGPGVRTGVQGQGQGDIRVRPGGTPAPGAVPNPGGVKPGNLIPPGGAPAPGNVPKPGGAAKPGDLLPPGGAPAPGNVPNPGGAIKPGNIPGQKKPGSGL